ncbi:hypothetical protein G7Y89_g2145 [Cudoniella acicularis]|uniref:Uncharacterized protein n=1 Tax=Cudoniella acicularis TaxID=354080 RepID=A0A8H4RVM7_9HELO|nr:hypothetical protein G7Y89_g2145 [Cudoniella acicularis]
MAQSSMAQSRITFSRQRTPLLIGTFLVGSAFFIGLKWRAVMQRSEAAKQASSKTNYNVQPGERSGKSPTSIFGVFNLNLSKGFD